MSTNKCTEKDGVRRPSLSNTIIMKLAQLGNKVVLMGQLGGFSFPHTVGGFTREKRWHDTGENSWVQLLANAQSVLPVLLFGQ